VRLEHAQDAVHAEVSTVRQGLMLAGYWPLRSAQKLRSGPIRSTLVAPWRAWIGMPKSPW
jgi:hypothetical protein